MDPVLDMDHFQFLQAMNEIDMLEILEEKCLYDCRWLFLCSCSLVLPPWTIPVPRSFNPTQDSETEATTDNTKPLE